MSQFFDVRQFKGLLANGGARSNQFLVSINFPSKSTSAKTATEFLVTAAALPGQQMGVASVFYRGRAVNFSGDRTFAPWSVSVINDTGFVIRNELEKWMNGMEDLANKTGDNFYVNYQTNIEVKQLDKNGGVLKTIKLIDAFPTTLSDIALSHDLNNQISTFSCDFIYQHFEINNNQTIIGRSISDTIDRARQAVGFPG